jgi:hypothetical protein
MASSEPLQPEVFVELQSSRDECYANAKIEGLADQIPRSYVGVHGSREEALSEAVGWALGWLRRLRAPGSSSV